jgi:hypothetical protein
MKKIMMFLMVAVMMLGVSGQAMAFFGNGELIRVAYWVDPATNVGFEYATDLGNFTTLTNAAALSGSTTISTSNFDLSAAKINAPDWSNVAIAYFMMSPTMNGGAGAAWTSGDPSLTTSLFGSSMTQFKSAVVNPAGLYNAAGTVSVQKGTGTASSYYTFSNDGGSSLGTMFYSLDTSIEASLAAFGSGATYIDQLLLYYGSTPNAGAAGTMVATIRTNADGSTTLIGQAPPAVPIPAAAYLFGSGLLGMFGLRRKMAA